MRPRALLLLLCCVGDRAQARRRGRRFCSVHPLPADDGLEGIIDIARAVERTACDWPPRLRPAAAPALARAVDRGR